MDFHGFGWIWIIYEKWSSGSDLLGQTYIFIGVFLGLVRYQLPGTWSLVHGVGYEGRATSDTGYLLSLATKGIRICHITRVGAQSVCQVLGYRAG